MGRIFITGVGGNVGQYIANNLMQAGYTIIGAFRNSIPQNVDYDLVQMDLAEKILGGGHKGY